MDVKDIIDRVKDMQYFTVSLDLDEPLNFNGVVPFDTMIVDNIATFKVLASSYEEAENKVFTFLWGREE
jgi:hypothetical protein